VVRMLCSAATIVVDYLKWIRPKALAKVMTSDKCGTWVGELQRTAHQRSAIKAYTVNKIRRKTAKRRVSGKEESTVDSLTRDLTQWLIKCHAF